MVKSSCVDDFKEKWNSRDIGKKLKAWINSLTLVEHGYKEIINLRMKFVQEQNSKIVRYIGNLNCVTNDNVNPVWQTAGIISTSQFNDGFFYSSARTG